MNRKARNPDKARQSSGSAGQADILRRVGQPTPQRFDIRIAADGNWYHEGGLIGRPALVRLFASVLRREADGDYWLVTPVERGRIDVEDVPFLIVAAEIEGEATEQVIKLRTNVDDEITLGPAHPLVMRHPPHGEDLRPYVTIRPGLEGKLSRPVFYELANRGVEGPQGRVGVWSAGEFFALDGDGQ